MEANADNTIYIDLDPPSPARSDDTNPTPSVDGSAVTEPLATPATPATLEQILIAIQNDSLEMRQFLRQTQSLNRQHQSSVTAALEVISGAVLQQRQERNIQSNVGYIYREAEPRRKSPIDVSDPAPSPTAQPKIIQSSAQAARHSRSTPYSQTYSRGKSKSVTVGPLLKRRDRPHKFDYDNTESEDSAPRTPVEADDGASSPHIPSAHSSPAGLSDFNDLVNDRATMLSDATSRYIHVTTVHSPLNNDPYILHNSTIPAVIKWYASLLPYVKDGGTKHYCDLINRRIIEAIQRKSKVTQAAFFRFSNQETLNHLFVLIRPVNTLDWSRNFTDYLQYPGHNYSTEFLHQQTVRMKLEDLAKFVDNTVDLIFVLGDLHSPTDRLIRKAFESKLPAVILSWVHNCALLPGTPFLRYLSLLKEQIAYTSDTDRLAAPMQLHLAGPVTQRSRAQVSPGPQLRPSTYAQRQKFGLLTADDIHGPGDSDPSESELSAEESQILEDNGIYALTSPVTPAKYAAIKDSLDYPAHLRYPEGPNPCWTFYNHNACSTQHTTCPFEHDLARIEAYRAIKRQREAYLPSKSKPSK